MVDERVIRESGMDVHLILQRTGNVMDEVSGTIFEISEEELAKADLYEVNDYKRAALKLKSDRTCWVYVAESDVTP